MYHTLTDTDSTSLQFLFVSDPTSDIPDTKYQVDKGKMQKKTSLKTKFSQFMDKRFYLSLHLFHPLIKEQEDLKKTTVKKLRDIFGIKKRNC